MSIPICHIQQGQSFPIYSPPSNYRLRLERKQKRLINQKAPLTKAERLFCWQMALFWDPVRAVCCVWDLVNERYAYVFADHLLAQKRIKRGIVASFRKQLEMAGEDENSLVLEQIKHTQKILNRALEALATRIEEGKLVDGDVTVWKTALEMAKDITDKNSELLGYVGPTENFKMLVSGNRQLPTGLDHKLPEPRNGNGNYIEVVAENLEVKSE